MFSNYLEMRQLRKDVKELGRSNDYEKRERESAEHKLRTVERELKTITTERDNAIKARDKYKDKLREQTGADLLVNALRELGVLPKPEKYNAFDEQTRLLSQYRGLGGFQQQSGLANALTGGLL